MNNPGKIRVGQRIFVVAASIMAALGVKDSDTGGFIVTPRKPSELIGSSEEGETDGDKIMNKVAGFLSKMNLPQTKQEQIINALKQPILFSNLSKPDADTNLSPLRMAYSIVFHEVVPAYRQSGSLDFTGKLFNVMNDWVEVPDGDANDVVLTPRYVTNLMARITNVNMNSYVWDWALGSGGFLISSMNQMLSDAKQRISSPRDLAQKQYDIKSKQLLGIEKLPDIYILAVLNMILMGDGSSNIINGDSLTYDGNYAYTEKPVKFPADVFLLNPPYSAPGNGMIFVQDALRKMSNGKAAVIIQDSAGSGKAISFNKEILKNNRLTASIKMPTDLFNSSVQTSIYVFDVGEPHQKDNRVKFIDFREDGYKRTNRKKSSTNLRDTGTAKDHYDELVAVIRDSVHTEEYIKSGENLVVDTIDPISGADWNYEQHQIVDTSASDNDFDQTTRNYLAWKLAQLVQEEK